MVKSVTNSSLKANSKQVYMDYHDGKYGINTDPNRGADTFIPFHSGNNIHAVILTGANNKDTNIAIYTFSNDKFTLLGYMDVLLELYQVTEYFAVAYGIKASLNWQINILKDCTINDTKYEKGQTIIWGATEKKSYVITI